MLRHRIGKEVAKTVYYTNVGYFKYEFMFTNYTHCFFYHYLMDYFSLIVTLICLLMIIKHKYDLIVAFLFGSLALLHNRITIIFLLQD